jgi:hypothetical protein
MDEDEARPARAAAFGQVEVERVALVRSVGNVAPNLDALARRGPQHAAELLDHASDIGRDALAPTWPDLGHQRVQLGRDRGQGTHRLLFLALVSPSIV